MQCNIVQYNLLLLLEKLHRSETICKSQVKKDQISQLLKSPFNANYFFIGLTSTSFILIMWSCYNELIYIEVLGHLLFHIYQKTTTFQMRKHLWNLPRGVCWSLGNIFLKVYFSKLYFSKEYFCEVYPVYASSKLCEFIPQRKVAKNAQQALTFLQSVYLLVGQDTM